MLSRPTFVYCNLPHEHRRFGGETEKEREKGRRRITVDHPEKRGRVAIQNFYEENVFYRRAFARTTPLPCFVGEGERDWPFLAQISKPVNLENIYRRRGRKQNEGDNLVSGIYDGITPRQPFVFRALQKYYTPKYSTSRR